MSAHFLYFLFKWKRVNQQVCLKEYVENQISNSTSHKKKVKKIKNKKRGAKT